VVYVIELSHWYYLYT